MTRVRIATRGSDLALAQAHHVAALLRGRLAVETELVVVKTTGDRIQEVSLSKIGGKGLFVKEIEEALLSRRADVAVHSAKDLPAALPEELVLAAFPEREDPRDALVCRRSGGRLVDLPAGGRVGTGSVRRTALLRSARSDIEVVPLRGNVPTRLRKLEEQDLDAVILACAGLERLGLAERIDERIDPDWMLPAVCQGTLALEARAGEALADDLAALDDAAAAVAVRAERAFLTRLEGDCSVPLAAYAEPTEVGIRVRGLLARTDGSSVLRAERSVERDAAADAGAAVAEEILGAGGAQLLAELQDPAASTFEPNASEEKTTGSGTS